MEKIQHNYKCQNCGKPATKNIQQTWHEYDILNDGGFDEVESWEGNNNEFYCDECWEKEQADIDNSNMSY